MSADDAEWENEVFGVDLATLGRRRLFLYRMRHVTELALATVEDDDDDTATRQELKHVRLRSVRSDLPTIINFRNTTNIRARAMWLDFAGHEIAYGIIEPGENKRYKTYATHPWIVRDCKTCSRLVVNQCEAIFGCGQAVDAVIRIPPVLSWTKERHLYFPPFFRERVRCLLLCHRRLEMGPSRSLGTKRRRECCDPGSGSAGVSPTLGDIPSLLLLKVVYYMSLEKPLLQTLHRGWEAAPDLTPVPLPTDVPLAEFSPDASHYPDEDSDFLDDSDIDEDD